MSRETSRFLVPVVLVAAILSSPAFTQPTTVKMDPKPGERDSVTIKNQPATVKMNPKPGERDSITIKNPGDANVRVDTKDAQGEVVVTPDEVQVNTAGPEKN